MLFRLGLMAFMLCIASTTFSKTEGQDYQTLKFNMDLGFASTIQSKMAHRFLGLRENQENEIDEIIRRFKKKAEEIKHDKTKESIAKLEELNALLHTQDQLLKEVLLPVQHRRLEIMPIYQTIVNEGLVNSMTNGLIASHLELSNKERGIVTEASTKALDEYRDDLEAAQKKALNRLRESLSVDKRKKFDELMEPMVELDGGIWSHSNRMLQILENATSSEKNGSNSDDK